MTHKHIFEHAKIVACRRNRFGSRRQNIRVDAKKKKTSWLKNQIKSLKIREAMKAENK